MANTTFLPGSASSNIALSGGNLIATASSATFGIVESQDSQNSGQFYVEFTFNAVAGAFTGAGFCLPAATAAGLSAGTAASALQVFKSGNVRLNGASSAAFSIGALTAGAVVCCALDLTNMRAFLRLGAGGNWNGSAGVTPATPSTGLDISGLFKAPSAPAWPFAALSASGDTITANFGDSAFVGTVPAGYTAGWPTQTVPTDLVVTQVGAEVWGSNPDAPLVVTQAGSEVWGVPTAPPLWVTQVGAEVWVDISTAYVAPPPPAVSAFPSLCVIT